VINKGFDIHLSFDMGIYRGDPYPPQPLIYERRLGEVPLYASGFPHNPDCNDWHYWNCVYFGV